MAANRVAARRQHNVGAPALAVRQFAPQGVQILPSPDQGACYDPATGRLSGGRGHDGQRPTRVWSNGDGTYSYTFGGDIVFVAGSCGAGTGFPGGARPGSPVPPGGQVPPNLPPAYPTPYPTPTPQPPGGGGWGQQEPPDGCDMYCGPNYAQGCQRPVAPQLMTDPNGCNRGFVQCDMPLPLTSGSIAAGASTTLTLSPRDPGTPTDLSVVAAAQSWTIDSIQVGGVNFLDGAVPADHWFPTSVTKKALNWGATQISNTRPLTMVVTNYSAGALVFRAVILAATARAI